MAYLKSLKNKVIQDVRQGLNRRRASSKYRVSYVTVCRWTKNVRYKPTGKASAPETNEVAQALKEILLETKKITAMLRRVFR